MIGIVTGKVSGIAVLDFDTEYVMDYVVAPTVKTPRGYHYYFKYEDGITNTVNVGGEKIDVRGEGGYVVAPPSVNEEGKRYKWIQNPSIGFPEFPHTIFGEARDKTAVPKASVVAPQEEVFIEGRRDNDLFHIAHSLVKSGINEKEIRDVVLRLARTCTPPFPEKEALIKVDSAVKRAIRKEKPWIDDVKEWVSVTSGYFSVTTCYYELQAVTKQEMATVRQCLIRLRDARILESHPTKSGWYRRIQLDCEEIDWQNAPTNDLPIKFPLDIHDLVRIYPSNIIVIAGESNAGKTAFVLDFIRLNMCDYNIHYFNSEMGASELKIRLSLFKEVDEWKFTAWERSDNFIDVIRPNDINIIDFLDVTDEFYKVGGVIKGIHEKLKEGIAIIALQKNEGRDLGRGGALSIEKPRLYLSMGRGELRITKAKNWKGRENPNGMVREFKLYNGSEFVPISEWEK